MIRQRPLALTATVAFPAGVAIGQAAAKAIVTMRTGDGSDAPPPPLPPGTTPGSYRPMPPNSRAASLHPLAEGPLASHLCGGRAIPNARQDCSNE